MADLDPSGPAIARWWLHPRDPDGNLAGEVDDYQRLDVTLRFNGVDSGVLDIARQVPAADVLLEPGAGLVVRAETDDGTIHPVTSGPIVNPARRFDASGDRCPLTFVSDDVWIASRIAHPSPADGDPATQEADVRTGPAETVIKGYVDANAGPSALAARQVPGLYLETDAATGDTVTGRGRFHNLTDLIGGLALSGGGLGWRLRQATADDPSPGLIFEVYTPTDRTGSVVFTIGLGNLAGFGYDENRPGATTVYVGGGGEGTARTVAVETDTNATARWGRIEAFRDRRDTTDPGELTQAGVEELAALAGSVALDLSPVDTRAVAYLTDYGLGDKVRAIVDGVQVDEVVRQVRLTLAGGEATKVAPIIGAPSRTSLLRLFDELRQVRSRVAGLERR